MLEQRGISEDEAIEYIEKSIPIKEPGRCGDLHCIYGKELRMRNEE